MRILLVNDHAGVRLFMRSALERTLPGCKVRRAEDGDKALKIYRRAHVRRYDLVLTDVDHPGLDGFALIDAMRKENPQQKVGIISARFGKEAAESKVPFLGLPFKLQQLVDFVLQILDLPRIVLSAPRGK